ncbi:MAG: SDR family NAD(P)-dependent oxidoreductase [Myxococcales bacterium]|nr:SDR family NAD(P)-dependent oxidoreductase [Myxococcales bacterium]
MNNLDLRNRRVLVTGASAGLGEELARQLATVYGAHPVLVARRRDKLEALAASLRSHDITPEVEAADLSDPAEAEALLSRIDSDARPLAGAIFNAGVTLFGPSTTHASAAMLNLLATNVNVPVVMLTEMARRFAKRPEGGALMVVSSLAGTAPLPWQALYGASKALVTSYGLCLGHELRDTPVSVTVFAPGGIATPMLDQLGGAYKKGDFGIMDVDQCARIALEGMLARESLVVPGLLNKLNRFLMKVGPRDLVMQSVTQIYRNALKAHSA